VGGGAASPHQRRRGQLGMGPARAELAGRRRRAPRFQAGHVDGSGAARPNGRRRGKPQVPAGLLSAVLARVASGGAGAQQLGRRAGGLERDWRAAARPQAQAHDWR